MARLLQDHLTNDSKLSVEAALIVGNLIILREESFQNNYLRGKPATWNRFAESSTATSQGKKVATVFGVITALIAEGRTIPHPQAHLFIAKKSAF